MKVTKANRRFEAEPKEQVTFRHVDSGWEETCDVDSATCDRLESSDRWERLGGDGGSEDEVRASAAAVKLAEDLGVDLAYVEGTGKGGSITKGDVEDAAESDEDEDDGGSED